MGDTGLTKKVRRTQVERTAETKSALIDATVSVIYRLGYGGATTALIAEEAGVSRGAILHHFGTRAELMDEVIRDVFEKERNEYEQLGQKSHFGFRVPDWPAVMWTVFSRPSGLAVLEILQAARSDPDLSERIKTTQQAIEQQALGALISNFDAPRDPRVLDLMRLMVWAIRGLAIGQVLVKDPAEIERSVEMFRRILETADKAGAFRPST
jgi:AcrR family transcriptional regulator